MINRCNICAYEGNLSHWDKEQQWLTCSNCETMYKKQIVLNTSYFYQDISKRSKQSIKEKALSVLDRRFYQLVANAYFEYLLSKTNLKFKNAFDVGAMLGTFVAKLNRHSIDARGIEPNKLSVRSAVTNKIEWGYFDENYKPKSKYDLVCLTQMLYYVQNPYAVIDMAKKMLTDNGLIFISTYNPSSSIIRNGLIPELIDSNMNILLSKKNYESLREKLGLKLIDYTCYRPDLYLYLASRRINALNLVKRHLMFYFKKPFVEDKDGYHVFLLLKPIN